MSDTPKVSIIIPVYNCVHYLARCLDSVFEQTFQDFEVIAINDGSTDDSLAVLEEYATKHPQLRVFDQANAGQGAARNRALEAANGEYILFVDADDFIEAVLLEVTVARAEKDQSDFVHFDWKLYKPSPERKSPYLYENVDPFWHHYTLSGAECDELLRVKNLYCVTNLYRKSFLDAHCIRFEVGRIYEDNPFVVHAVNRAVHVSLVHSPLYIVNPQSLSTTRRDTGTEKHYRDHVYAVRRSFHLLEERGSPAAVYLASYHVKKFGPYYARRVPRKYRREYVRDFIDAIHEMRLPAHTEIVTNAPFKFAENHRVFSERRYRFFRAFTVTKNWMMPHARRVTGKLKYVIRRVKGDPSVSPRTLRALNRDPEPGLVCFLGFDSRYVGNSKALFERLLRDSRFSALDIKYVTTDERVPQQHRLLPGSTRAYEAIAGASIVFAESWVDPNIVGNVQGKWVQLWHGTPVKRVLFDSHESTIVVKRPNHKVNKYRDILRWDTLIADSPGAVGHFCTGFLMDPQQIILTGYPRVHALRELAQSRPDLNAVRQRLSVSPEQKIVLYAPTWRDENYGKSEGDLDLSYRLDTDRLAAQLGHGWVVITHEHHYQSPRGKGDGTDFTGDVSIDASGEEIEMLIALSDLVITDYSSVVFDALSIGVDALLYATDVESFDRLRGLYEEPWDILSVRNHGNVDGIFDKIVLKSESSTIAGEARSVKVSQPGDQIIQYLSVPRNRDTDELDRFIARWARSTQ